MKFYSTYGAGEENFDADYIEENMEDLNSNLQSRDKQPKAQSLPFRS